MIRAASKEVGPALFYSLLIITFSFLPVFTLQAQEGRLFKPLAFTKTYAMGASALLAITIVPILMGYLIKGRILPEKRNPINRWLIPLVSTGQLALTLYVAHVIIGMGTLEAFGCLEQRSLIFSVNCALAFCVLSVAFAHLWASRFKRGPLESIMRRLVG